MKKKISLMLAIIMMLQIILLILTVVWESDLTIKSLAADEQESTVDGITWRYTLKNGEATNVRPKDKTTLPTEVIIPNTLEGHDVTSIGVSAFYGCDSLTSIEIPDSVTSIGYKAFYDCSRLTSINVDKNNKNYSSEEGILFNKEKTEIIQYPAGKVEISYTIPDSVTSIGDYAFYRCDSLTSIEIPDSVTSIGDSAFSYCNRLTSIEIPDSVTSIGGSAFEDCNRLTSIEIPDSVTSIGYWAFSYCSSLTSIEIPDSVTSIGDYAFYSCDSLTSINVDKNNKNYSSEEGILFNKEKTEIIKYPAGKVEISYTIPNSVTSIGDRAFSYCSSLTSIEIPDSVTSIGDDAFYGCDSLTIYCKSNSYAEEFAKTNSINYIIDDTKPTITSVSGNPTKWTKENVTLTINAEDTSSGLADKAYSFDGGETWQAENTKTYTENTSGIIIQVKDNLGNIKTYEEEINITKIIKLTKIEITNEPSKTTYVEGQSFDATGIKVTATYNNGETKEITNYTIKDRECLEQGQTSVTISYTEGNVTKTTTQEIIVILKGDANGDNKVDFMDILAINKHRLGKAQLTGVYLETADVNEDGKVDFMDILQINKYRLGKINSL